MFNFICKSFPYMRNSIRALPTQRLQHSFQLNHLLSSSQPRKTLKNVLSENAKDGCFTVNYLINKCGLPPENAVSASKYFNFNKPDKPDAVIAFLKNQGFSETQVLKLIRIHPRVISCDPGKTLLPKIEFFLSQGIPKADMLVILTAAPVIFKLSLERRVIPSFNCLKTLLGSAEETILPIRRCSRLFTYIQNHVVPNVEILRKVGVPEARIKRFLMSFPSTMVSHPNRFKQVVEEVRELGVGPVKSTFLVGITVILGLSRSSWKKKMEVYKIWGCSEDEVLAGFVTYPWCMATSQDKIDRIMGFFVNEMGWDSSRLMRDSRILSMSFNQRIIPRCSVYRFLLSKGFIREHSSLYTLLHYSEDEFLKKCVECYKNEAPELSKLYQEKMKLSS